MAVLTGWNLVLLEIAILVMAIIVAMLLRWR